MRSIDPIWHVGGVGEWGVRIDVGVAEGGARSVGSPIELVGGYVGVASCDATRVVCVVVVCGSSQGPIEHVGGVCHFVWGVWGVCVVAVGGVGRCGRGVVDVEDRIGHLERVERIDDRVGVDVVVRGRSRRACSAGGPIENIGSGVSGGVSNVGVICVVGRRLAGSPIGHIEQVDGHIEVILP